MRYELRALQYPSFNIKLRVSEYSSFNIELRPYDFHFQFLTYDCEHVTSGYAHTFRYGGEHLLAFPRFSTLSFAIQYPSSQQSTTAHDTAETFTNTRTNGVFGFLTGRSVFNLCRLRRRLDDLHMGTARMGYTRMALWIFDFSLALAGVQHHKRAGWRVNSPLYAALDGNGSVSSFSPLRDSGSGTTVSGHGHG